MSILSQEAKKILVEEMRRHVCGILKESATLTSKQATDKSKFISESATYEQLLNITFNPLRESKYLPAYVLEGAAAIIHRACLTGRKTIGINAITEGALKLQSETGAIITESMLDAALTSVNEGSGLKIIGNIIEESLLFESIADVRTALDILSHKPDAAQYANAMNILRNNHLDGAAAEIGQMSNNGASAQEMGRKLLAFRRQQEYDALKRTMSTPGYTVQQAHKDRLARLEKALKLHQKSGNRIVRSNNASQIANNALQVARGGGGGMSGLTKAAIGIGAGAAGLWAWNKYNQNKQAMQEQQ